VPSSVVGDLPRNPGPVRGEGRKGYAVSPPQPALSLQVVTPVGVMVIVADAALPRVAKSMAVAEHDGMEQM
jgi:hypothetical protein